MEFFSRKSYTVCKTFLLRRLAEYCNPNGDEESGRRGTQQGMEMKRRIALVTAGWKRMITTAWSTGLIAYIRDHGLDVSVEWFHSWEGASQNTDFRHGEDNIFTLPEFAGYDGIVVDLVNMESAARESVLQRIRESGVPAVALCQDIEGMFYISVKGFGAIQRFVLHLYEEHGCRSFHFAGGPKGNYENEQRVSAFLDTLRELGVPEEAATVSYGDFGKNTGTEAVRFLTKNGGKLPDAIICANDNIAVAAVIEAEKLGYRVPADVKVTGFDNFDKAQLFQPQITTAEVCREDIGYRCADILNQIWNGEKPERVSYIEPKVILGESCGCPNDGKIDYRKVLKQQIVSSMEDADLTAALSSAEAKLHDSQSFQELVRSSMDLFDQMDLDGYAVILDRRVQKLEEKNELNTDGYELSCLETAGCRMDGMRREHIPNVKIRDEVLNAPAGTLYLMFPFHIDQYAAGIFILKNPRFLIDRQDLYEIIELILREASNRYANLRLRSALNHLEKIYNRDQLTGVYARTAYQKVIAPSFQRWRRKEGVAVMFLDADRFKEINDRFGHSYGDYVLKEIAKIVVESLPAEAVVCRFGGDEFLALYPCGTQEAALAFRTKIEQGLLEKSIQTSIGIAVYAGTEDECNENITLEELVKMADANMYRIKEDHHSQK